MAPNAEHVKKAIGMIRAYLDSVERTEIESFVEELQDYDQLDASEKVWVNLAIYEIAKEIENELYLDEQEEVPE